MFDDHQEIYFFCSQVIKVLLVAVTSEYCNVHEGGLLLAVRACFHVNLITKNQANKTTAKAALTQMLSVVNQRMEVHETRLKSLGSSSSSSAGKVISHNEESDGTQKLDTVGSADNGVDEKASHSNTGDTTEESLRPVEILSESSVSERFKTKCTLFSPNLVH
jgi:uncharacterized protein YwlG (UPF0340 family)